MSNENSYFPALTIRVLWNSLSGIDADPNGPLEQLADSLHAYFNRCTDNPLDRGMGIPVFFHAKEVPEVSILEKSRHTILVVLIDDLMVISPKWIAGLADLKRAVSASGLQHRFYPVALTSNAFNIDSTLATTNFIRLQDESIEQRVNKLTEMLTHELCRLLLDSERAESCGVEGATRISPAPVMLFLSHAKADGEELAKTLRNFIESTSAVQSFFDANDIAPGFNFQSELEGNIERSVLVVLQTDSFASRAWCRREVLWAKRKGCPLIIINAVERGEERGFPYLGNAPSLRIQSVDDTWCRKIIRMALKEMLSHLWFRENLKTLVSVGLVLKDMEAYPSPPEIVTLLTREHGNEVAGIIYPDPPLGREELDLLYAVRPNLDITTPISSVAKRSGIDGALLKDVTIGLSISNSPDLIECGMGNSHLNDAMLELARYFLAMGANLAYGGDLRPGGFTENLLELIWAYNSTTYADEDLSPEGRATIVANKLSNYVAWPIHLNYSVKILAQHNLNGAFKFIDPPSDLKLDQKQLNQFVPPDSAEHRYLWFRSLTAMRELMSETVQVRVLLGGQVTGYAGGIPGLLEECLLATRKNQPVFVLGGMGGASGAIADAIEGKTTEALTEKYQCKNEAYAEFIKYIDLLGSAKKIDYQSMVDELKTTGIRGLNNGLTKAENRILFTTPYISEMISLVLKGLVELKKMGVL